MTHCNKEPSLLNFWACLSQKPDYNYNYPATLFSEVKDTTIKYLNIAHNIERAKELLIYNELNLTKIAGKLYYNNVAHLSNQFNKVTGLTSTFFKKMKHKRMPGRRNL